MITRFSGTIYPDKTFSIGLVPPAKKKPSDSLYDRLRERQFDSFSEAVLSYGKIEKVTTVFVTDPYELSRNRRDDVYDNGRLGSFVLVGIEEKLVPTRTVKVDCLDRIICSRPLLVESPKSSRDLPKKYGKHGITRFGRKFVKNVSLLLERKYSKERLGFVTCTCPRYSEAYQRAINERWSEVTRRFYQKVKRQLEKVSQPFVYVGVTEIQEKRFRDTGLPVPHLHFVYLCRGVVGRRYWLYICQLHRAWNEALAEVIALAGLPITPYAYPSTGSVHAKRVRKSVSAYLGKYMSKGSSVLAEMKEAGFEEFPRQWWTAPVPVKEMFKNSLIRLSQSFCETLFYDCKVLKESEFITWMRWVFIESRGQKYRCGLSGELSYEFYDKIRRSQLWE